ncbi:non-canonical purine NTP diphosphatase [Phaeodactylibacter luteus]|uniref:dITP/XTP pyrophosphatase n=1 Tax=Phaeodactylibacter luteus TaxID=1564516 RepID=A0A5C6RJI2_9BACT|nr:non-canonical purine NTP diphosphatase [Phaeodactylibacter luteus]TXB62069.1 non-canonical purine NTP diphosphatase [Phaeodactylibacter luteus]
MPTLVFATGNANKIKEVEQQLNGQFELLSLKDINCEEELPETRPTIEGNALEKATYVHEHYNVDCFSEDTGLEVDALGGEPGVYSARYAGPAHDDEANMSLLLANLKGKEDRSARFRTVIALILNGQVHTFEGVAEGQIIHRKKGNNGFGYDPIFIPDGHDRTFAQMDTAEKSAISHRGQAVAKLVAFLNEQD